MSDTPTREWRFYVADMIAFAENITSYTDGFSHEHFINSGITYDATLRNLELIGEAATQIRTRSARPICCNSLAHDDSHAQ